MANSGTTKWIVFTIIISVAFQLIESQNCSMIAVCNCTVEYNKSAASAELQQSAEPTAGSQSAFVLQDSAYICKRKTSGIANVTDVKVTCASLNPATSTPPEPLKEGQFKLTLAYPCAKPTPSENHGYSTGSVLVIIFFTLVLTYLILGMPVNYFILGARGFEIVPNLAFWRDLPGLVRDGVIFIQNGFKPPSMELNARSPESYDAI